MTVTELIGLLEECDPDATVRIMSQESWPFENAVRGISVRQDFADSSCDCETDRDTHDVACPAPGNYAEGLEPPTSSSSKERRNATATRQRGMLLAADRGGAVPCLGRLPSFVPAAKPVHVQHFGDGCTSLRQRGSRGQRLAKSQLQLRCFLCPFPVSIHAAEGSTRCRMRTP